MQLLWWVICKKDNHSAVQLQPWVFSTGALDLHHLCCTSFQKGKTNTISPLQQLLFLRYRMKWCLVQQVHKMVMIDHFLPSPLQAAIRQLPMLLIEWMEFKVVVAVHYLWLITRRKRLIWRLLVSKEEEKEYKTITPKWVEGKAWT